MVSSTILTTVRDRWISKVADREYSCAAEPPVRCGESHPSGVAEPPLMIWLCISQNGVPVDCHTSPGGIQSRASAFCSAKRTLGLMLEGDTISGQGIIL